MKKLITAIAIVGTMALASCGGSTTQTPKKVDTVQVVKDTTHHASADTTNHTDSVKK